PHRTLLLVKCDYARILGVLTMTRNVFRSITVILALLFSVALAQQGMYGTWQGEIGQDTIGLGVFVTLEGPSEEPSGTLAIPAQGLIAAPLAELTIDGDAVSFTLPDVPGEPV